MLRVVIDTNVLVSAVLKADGAPSQVVRAAFQQRLTLIVSTQLLDELVGVLARPKIARTVPPERAQLFVEAVEGVAVAVGDPAEIPTIATSTPSSARAIDLPRFNAHASCGSSQPGAPEHRRNGASTGAQSPDSGVAGSLGRAAG